MDYVNSASAQRRGPGHSSHMPPQPSPTMGPPPVPTRSQRYYYSRTGKCLSESQFWKQLEQFKAMASARTLPVETYQEAMWMLQQHHPQHALLQGRTFMPPPGTAPQVLRRLGQEAAGRQHQQRQQHLQQRSPAPTANLIPTHVRQSVRSWSADPRAEATYRQSLVDPRLAAPRAPSQVMGPPAPRATQTRPQTVEHPMSNIRLDAYAFTPSSASLSEYVRNPNGYSTAQLQLPSGYVPNLPIQAPLQAPSVSRTQAASYMPHPSEVRSPSRPSPDAPKHGTRPLFSSLYPGLGAVSSPAFQSLSRPSPAAPKYGERPLFSSLSDGTDSTFLRHTTSAASRKATPISTAAPGSAPQMGMFAAPVSRPSSRQSKKARVQQQSVSTSSDAQGDKAPVQQEPSGSHLASAQSKGIHRQQENMPRPSIAQSSNERVQQSTARPSSAQSYTGHLPQQQHSHFRDDQGNTTRLPQEKSVSRPSSVQSNIARAQQQKPTQVSGGEDNSARLPHYNLSRPSNAQDNTVRVQQHQQLPVKSDQGSRSIKEAHSRISQSQDGAKVIPTLEIKAGKALKVAQALHLLSPAQAIEKAGNMRGDPVQQQRFIDGVREAIEATKKNSRAQRAASATASSNAVIDLTASGGSSNKRKEPPTNLEQPNAKRQEVIDLTEDDEPVRKPQRQRKQQPLTDMTNMSQQYPNLMDVDDESSTIHPLHSQATTQGVSLVDIAHGHDYHSFPTEPVECMLDPPEAVQECMRRRNAAHKPDVYVAEPSIAAAYDAVKTGKVDFCHAGNNGGYLAPVAEKAWTDIERYTIREADGWLRARNERPLSEEGAIVRYELMMHGLRYGWWPRRQDYGYVL